MVAITMSMSESCNHSPYHAGPGTKLRKVNITHPHSPKRLVRAGDCSQDPLKPAPKQVILYIQNVETGYETASLSEGLEPGMKLVTSQKQKNEAFGPL